MENLIEINSEYQAGVCNIGPYEIKKRRQNLLYSLIGVSIFVLIIFLLDLGNVWKILLFIPLLFTFINFLQVRYKFCVYFGFSSIVNFGDKGGGQRISEFNSHQKDMAKVKRMFLQAFVLSLVSTVGLYFLLP